MQKIDIFIKNLMRFSKKHLKMFHIHSTMKAGMFQKGERQG